MNKLSAKIFVLVFFITFLSGCDVVQKMSSSNANAEDKARETLGLKKTGIAECDQVVDLLSKKYKGNTNTQEESWTSRAATELIKQQIYDYINNGNANKTAGEKADLTEKCKTALVFLKDEQKK